MFILIFFVHLPLPQMSPQQTIDWFKNENHIHDIFRYQDKTR